MMNDISERPPLHVFVAIPAYGCKVHTHFATSLMKLQTCLVKHGIRMTTDLMGNESLITRARSILAEKFLRSDATHLLFIDSDIVFHEDTVMKMLKSGHDIVCGPYAKKGINYTDIMKLENPTAQTVQQQAISYNVNLMKQKDHNVEQGFMEVTEAATGMMLISRHVLQTLRDTHGDKMVKNDIPGSRDIIDEYCLLFDTSICPETKRFLSEDYAFCALARNKGFRVMIYCLARLGHIGNVTRQCSLKARCETHIRA
jgi:hypothetical protein